MFPSRNVFVSFSRIYLIVRYVHRSAFFSFSFLRCLQRWLYRSPSVCVHFASRFFFYILHSLLVLHDLHSWLCSDHFDWFVLNDITQLNECTFCSVRPFARLQSVPLPPSRIFLPPFVHSHSSYIYFLYSYYTLLVFMILKWRMTLANFTSFFLPLSQSPSLPFIHSLFLFLLEYW